MFPTSRTTVVLGSGESLDGSYSENQSVLSVSTSSENLSSSREFTDSNSSLSNVKLYDVFCLGMAQDVNLGGFETRDPDSQLIDKIEESQLEGKIHLVPGDSDQVFVSISSHGVKVLDKTKKEVLQRHPLHSVCQVLHYEDSFSKNNIALKIGQVGRHVYDCYVFRCRGEEQATNICRSVKNVFDSVTKE